MRGPYCHACGQRQRSRVVTVRTFFRDALSEYFSLDNRFLRTLRRLVTQLGLLTNEYLAGRRARYTKPVRLYLIVSVLYFAVLALMDTETFFVFRASAESGLNQAFIRLLPKLMFVVLPAFALLLKGLHAKTGRLYVEHLIFALHYHAFAFLAFSLFALVNGTAEAAVQSGQWTALGIAAAVFGGALQIGVFVYLFLALRRVYRQPWWLTLLKVFAIWVGYVALLVGTGFIASLLARALGWF